MVWDNHGNIRDFSAALGKSGFFFRANLVLERLLHALSATVVVVSESEVRAYRELGFDTAKFAVVPTCADLAVADRGLVERQEARRRLGLGGEEVVLFFGTLRYEPNRDSARYISAEMMPAVALEHHHARTYIAGSGDLGEDTGPGVTLLGFVPDLYLWMSAADLCVAPVWKGVGILTKVIDMLSAGRAAVVSPLALEGIPELEHGRNCLVGRDREDFARQVNALLADPGMRERLGREGRRTVEEGYCWEVVGPRLRALLDGLIGPTSY